MEQLSVGRSGGADNYQWVGAVEQTAISMERWSRQLSVGRSDGADNYQWVGAVEQTTISR